MARQHLGLALLVFLVSCGTSPLLDSVQKDVEDWKQPVPRPSIVPAGGTYASLVSLGTVTLSAEPGTALFYTLDGSPPQVTQKGERASPATEKIFPNPSGATMVSPAFTVGTTTVRAIAWRGGKFSSEAMVTFIVY